MSNKDEMIAVMPTSSWEELRERTIVDASNMEDPIAHIGKIAQIPIIIDDDVGVEEGNYSVITRGHYLEIKKNRQ